MRTKPICRNDRPRMPGVCLKLSVMFSVELIMQQAPNSEMAMHEAAAVRQLFEPDAYLLQVDANERSITHRLALYLTPHFPDWDIDCEYNRCGDLPKRLMRYSKTSE